MLQPVLKHFQAATAEPHIPTPDGDVMTGIVKPEIRNVLQIGWAVVRGILELAIMVYILRRCSSLRTPSSLPFSASSTRRR
jgi:hypothetical protein